MASAMLENKELPGNFPHFRNRLPPLYLHKQVI